MNAVYDKTICPHRICADPSKVIDYLKNFPPSMCEVGLVAAQEALTLQNEVEASAELRKQQRTTLLLVLPPAIGAGRGSFW